MWELEDLVNSVYTQKYCLDKWVPARPENFKPKYCSIFKRLKYAWEVVIGKAETFKWPGEQ